MKELGTQKQRTFKRRHLANVQPISLMFKPANQDLFAEMDDLFLKYFIHDGSYLFVLTSFQ
jgi:hypothetical protein